MKNSLIKRWDISHRSSSEENVRKKALDFWGARQEKDGVNNGLAALGCKIDEEDLLIMKEVYYKPSGKFSLSFLPYFILFQALSIPLLSIIYIYLTYYMPLIYLNFFITVGCGFIAGFVMVGVIHVGKVRSNKIALLFSIIAVCLLTYAEWCVYIPLVFTNAYEMYELTFYERLGMSLHLLIHPSMVFESIGFINQIGVWSVFAIGFKGGLLTIVWLLEFLLMTTSACIVSTTESKSPFCEKDGAWYVQMPNIIIASLPEDFDSIKKDMEGGDFNELTRLSKDYQEGDPECLSLTFYKARNSEHYYLTIKKRTVTSDKGKEKTREHLLIEYISIDNNSVAEIQASFSQA